VVSRGTKGLAGGSLLVTAGGMVALGWELSRMDVAAASQWAAIVQGFAALLAVPGLVFAGLAVRQSGAGQGGGHGGVAQSVTFGPVKAGGNVDQRAQQHSGRDQDPGASGSAGASGTS
jgi:hypothetical protein